MPHLLLAVTAHGYGHLAQAAPVVAELARRMPGLRVTLQGDVDPGFARDRLPAGFTQVPGSTDPVLLMNGPLVIRWEESLPVYARFEADYDRHLERQLDGLRRLAPDLVLADVPWLPLDAARRLGIPAIGLCSLTWYDILQESPVREQVPTALLDRMRTIYGAADLFIRPAPAMPMAWLPNARDVGPIARRAPDRGGELRARFGCPADRPLALMQFGGFGGFEPLTDWPEQDQVHWVVQDLKGQRRRDASALGDHGLNLLDLLGSFDLVLTKPGYGSYAEAACNGVPVLQVPRDDWPEAAALNGWIRRQVPTRELGLADLQAGRVATPIAELLAAGRPAPIEPTGIAACADLLEPWLRG
jgi:hypothetical protein